MREPATSSSSHFPGKYSKKRSLQFLRPNGLGFAERRSCQLTAAKRKKPRGCPGFGASPSLVGRSYFHPVRNVYHWARLFHVSYSARTAALASSTPSAFNGERAPPNIEVFGFGAVYFLLLVG